MDDAARAWIRLSCCPGLGPRWRHRLLEAFGGPEAAAGASVTALARTTGRARAERFHRGLFSVDVDGLCRDARRAGQTLWTPASDDWPHMRLAALADAPCLLFLRGRFPRADTPAVAVVGTREAGARSLDLARDLARVLAEAGVAVGSGLALGVDGAAHEGALSADAAPTFAVLGSALDVCYPPEHHGLAERIAGVGALLSEHPPGTRPHAGHFPRRNRLVAALTEATVVIEAPERSGALSTARWAVELGRDVWAAPGPAGRPSHRGCHDLIRRGMATLLDGPEEVLEAFGLAHDPAACRPLPPSGPPLAIWGVLGADEVLDADELGRRTGLGPAEVAEGLGALELDGRIARVPGVGVRRLG